MKTKTLKTIFSLFLILCYSLRAEPDDAVVTSTPMTDGGAPASAALVEIRALVDQATEFDTLKQLQQELACLQEAAALLEVTPDAALECEVYALFSSTYMHLENLFLALEYAEKARLIADRLNDNGLLSLALLNVGNINLKFRKYEDSIKSFQHAMEYAEKQDNEKRMIACFNSLAVCYWRLKNWELCEKYLRLAMEQMTEGSAHYYLILNNIGLIFVEQGRYSEAEKNLLRSLKFNRESGSSFSLALNLSNLADLEVRRGNIERAIGYAQESLETAEALQSQYILARTYRHLARAYVLQDDLEKGEYYLLQSMKYAREMDDKAEQIETQEVLFDLYRERGNFREALAIQTEVNHLQNELLNVQSRTESILFNVRYESESKERKIQLLLKEKELADLKAREQNLQMMRTEKELEIAEQTQQFQIKLRNVMILALSGFAVGIVVMLVLFTGERKLRKHFSQQKLELDEANANLQSINQQLEATNREKDDILGIVAHDLRNPLAVQIGLGQLLMEGAEGMELEDVKEYARDIVSSSTRMNEIITLLLNANKLEQGVIQPNLQQVALSELLLQVCQTHQFQIKEKHQTLLHEIPVDLPCLVSDPSLLLQIFDNLLSNAVKYSPAFNKIWLLAERIDERVEIRVEDEGPGVLPEEQSLLFEKYKTTSNPTTAGESAIGLGLSIAKQLVEMLGGKIWYEARSGGGSVFSVTFPVKP